MTHNYYNRNNGYGRRYRSEAWHMDGGANDEGYHTRYCTACASKTEHGITEGCIPCGDKMAASAARRRAQSSEKK